MRYVILLIALLALPAQTQAASPPNRNSNHVWLSTPYPSLEVSADEPIQLPITVHNTGDGQQRVDLSVTGIPHGWTASLRGDGKPVRAVLVEPDATSDLKLHLSPPESIKAGTYGFLVKGTIGKTDKRLPIQITLGKKSPAKISIKPEFPDLRGAAGSEFTFKLTLKNDSAQDALIGLEAQAPEGFQTTFNKEYESQQITSIPVKAGSSEDIEAKIKPYQGVNAAKYKVRIRGRAQKLETFADLTLTVTGQPDLSLTGPDGRISDTAYAGEETPLKLVLANVGTAPAREVELSATEPKGWKVKFGTKKITDLEPGAEKQVSVLLTPARQAVAGDYMIKVKANGDSVSSASDYRISVHTSTIWGAVGIAVIAAAVLMLLVVMVRFGRR